MDRPPPVPEAVVVAWRSVLFDVGLGDPPQAAIPAFTTTSNVVRRRSKPGTISWKTLRPCSRARSGHRKTRAPGREAFNSRRQSDPRVGSRAAREASIDGWTSTPVLAASAVPQLRRTPLLRQVGTEERIDDLGASRAMIPTAHRVTNLSSVNVIMSQRTPDGGGVQGLSLTALRRPLFSERDAL